MSETKTYPQFRIPQIILAEDIESSLPLEHTTVNVQVTGPVASVVVKQRFGNSIQEPAELDYLFPLPEDAAIVGFELRVGSRQILGDLQESQTAREAYEQARTEGQRSGLFEQRRPNLFAIRLANVQVGETIHTIVRFQQRLQFDDGVYTFVYPMGLTPKYDNPEHPGEGEGVHAPVASGSEPVGPVEINLAVDAGLAVNEPESPSHPLETTRLDERRFQVRLAGEQIPDRDFVLRYAVSGVQVQAAGWASGESGKEYFLATLVPPRMAEDVSAPQPREFIFVLDRSGSMSGEPIAQARNALRACLRTLNPEDTFRILLFDNRLEWFQPETSPAVQEQVDRADAFLNKVQGRGGTEIVPALEAALSLPAGVERTRYIVFLTDGAVSAEARALEQIRRRIGSTRLFTFGIGSAVNRALLSRMARLGRGRAAFLQLNEDIEGAIIRFQDSVSFPLISDLTLEWENGKAWDVYPARLPELYAGEPLEITGRLARTGGSRPVRLTLRGRRVDQPVQIQFQLPEAQGKDPAVGSVWARARIDDLLEQQAMEPERADEIKAEIIGLALEHNLVSGFTSFVAIDQEKTDTAGKPKVIHVAQPLPQGLWPQVYTAPGGGLPRLQRMGATYAAAALPLVPSAPVERMVRAKMSLAGEEGTGFSAAQEGFLGRSTGRKITDGEAGLRWLARTQNLDGSWGGDVERTAAALLAFLRAGQTTRTGSFRQALRKAARWLGENPGHGFEAFVRARVLQELAEATGDEKDRAAAQAARLVLSPAGSDLESAALGQLVRPPEALHSLDDLRLAGLLQIRLPVSLDPGQGDLLQTWAAVISSTKEENG